MTAIGTIARIELVSAARRRWTPLFTAALALLVMATAAASGAVHDTGGSDTLERTAIAVVPLMLALVPLAALLMGVTGHAGEPGSETFLFTQPVSRKEVLLGKWTGQLLAVWGAIAFGVGGGAAIVAAQSDLAGWPAFAVLVAGAMALGAVFLSIAALLAAATTRRGTALGACLFAWFGFVLLYDGVVIAVAQSLTGASGARVLFGSVFGNPVDLVRLFVLSWSGAPDVLGAAGESWTRFLGGSSRAIGGSAAAIVVWTLGPLAAAWRVLERRDL
jgi:Cu-processing system permease protein